MKKEVVVTSIAIHPYQAAIVKCLQSGKINFETDSLRGIAKKCGDKKQSAQQVKYHLQQLVKLGVLQIIRAQYVYYKEK